VEEQFLSTHGSRTRLLVVVTKAPSTYETPEPTQTPSGSQIPAEGASRWITHTAPSVAHEHSPKSRLRSMEHQKEHHHG
jgi:hypothetical protein